MRFSEIQDIIRKIVKVNPNPNNEPEDEETKEGDQSESEILSPVSSFQYDESGDYLYSSPIQLSQTYSITQIRDQLTSGSSSDSSSLESSSSESSESSSSESDDEEKKENSSSSLPSI